MGKRRTLFRPDGRLAYARPDGIGLVDIDGKYIKPLIEITPYNTRSDWAWLPPSPGARTGRRCSTRPMRRRPAWSTRRTRRSSTSTPCRSRTTPTSRSSTRQGCSPIRHRRPCSPVRARRRYQVAYLQAIFPEQSETSRYRVVVMDRDGSNRRTIFPANDAPGLQPQTPVWAPDPIDGQSGRLHRHRLSGQSLAGGQRQRSGISGDRRRAGHAD
ncbi:MAG: hypothetical protein MZV64_33040 [Ignavibacteriales bacterium]|nr:hypothetical protein [Ignavibacteriales bacterium]